MVAPRALNRGKPSASMEGGRKALVRAMESGEAAVSGRVQLVQESGEDVQAGFLMYVPVYRHDASIATPEERSAAFIGVVYSPFRIGDFVRATTMASQTLVALEVYDGAIASPDALMYRPPGEAFAGYTQLIEDEYGARLDGNARRYMGYVVEGTRRMKQLIDDLLELSRVGSRPARLEPVPGAEVVHEAAQALSQAIEDSRATIHYEELPAVFGDRVQLVQLFQNLVGNALKFRSSAPPRITISAERDAEWWNFAVADNGIGIERKYFDRIFVMFQRLHGREQYAGTGIGLAICKKIVERHGGLIWVESEPGRGATFCFTLRAADGVQQQVA